MASYYNIDDGFGNRLTAGLPPQEARRVAKRLANERGESVFLYEGGKAEAGAEMEEITPSEKTASLHHAQKKTPYHVYAPDGFESAHQSLVAAERAARRGAKNRRMEYRVYLTSPSGFTGGGHGTLTYTASPPRR